MATKFCSDWISGSQPLAGTNKCEILTVLVAVWPWPQLYADQIFNLQNTPYLTLEGMLWSVYFMFEKSGCPVMRLHCTLFITCNLIPDQCQNLGKIFTGPTYKLLLSFMFISNLEMFTGQNKTTYSKYCLIQWISKFPRSFEIHWVRQNLVNFTGLVGMVNTTVDKTEPIFPGLWHGKLS